MASRYEYCAPNPHLDRDTKLQQWDQRIAEFSTAINLERLASPLTTLVHTLDEEGFWHGLDLDVVQFSNGSYGFDLTFHGNISGIGLPGDSSTRHLQQLRATVANLEDPLRQDPKYLESFVRFNDVYVEPILPQLARRENSIPYIFIHLKSDEHPTAQIMGEPYRTSESSIKALIGHLLVKSQDLAGAVFHRDYSEEAISFLRGHYQEELNRLLLLPRELDDEQAREARQNSQAIESFLFRHFNGFDRG